MSQEIIEALAFAIAEKERRLEYYEKQVTELKPEIERLKQVLKAQQKDIKPLSI